MLKSLLEQQTNMSDPNRRNAHNEFSKQQILNDSFDRDYMMLAVEMLVENEAGTALLRQKSIATETQLDKLIGFEIPAYDYLALTYVASGNGVGEIETVVYKTGGSGGTTVATLTLAYNASNEVSAVTKS